VGYAQVVDFLKGIKPSGRKISEGLTGLQQEIELATRQLVKRQRTWFRSQSYIQNYLLDQDQEKLMQDLEQIYFTR